MAQKPPQTPPGETQMALQSAALAMQQGRYQEAERIAHDILARNAGDVGAMYTLGHALLLQKRAEEAIPPLERAAQQSRDPVIHTCLSMALRQVRRTDEALSRLKRVVKRDPPFPPAIVEYGVLLMQASQYDEAREVFNKGLAIAPNYLDLLRAAAPFFQAICDFPKAIEIYKQVLAIDPSNIGARIGLGICQFELGARDSALQNFRAATKGNRDLVLRVMNALTQAGHGSLWLSVRDAEAALL